MLGKGVGRVVLPQHFHKSKILRFHLVLDPEVRHRQVPCFTKAPAAADPDSRGGVGMHGQVEGKAHVLGNGSGADGF